MTTYGKYYSVIKKRNINTIGGISARFRHRNIEIYGKLLYKNVVTLP